MRDLPDFVIIGTKRGGTTSMYRYLLEHPQVLPLFPSARRWPVKADIKGIHFLDNRFEAGPSWYRSHFPIGAYRRAVSRRTGAPVLAGEASPYYLFHPWSAARAHAVIPEARLIVLLRDPVDRARSHYLEQRRRGFEPLPSLEQALDAEPSRLQGEVDRLMTDPGYRSFAHEHQSYVAQSEYAVSLRRWLAHFDRQQIHILRSEELFADPQSAYDGVVDFLGLLPHSLLDPTPFNAIIAPPPLPPSLENQLAARFVADQAELDLILRRSDARDQSQIARRCGRG